MDARAIAAAFDNPEDPAAKAAMDLIAGALGVLSRELVFQYMPLGGLNFAGSVARGIFRTEARRAFLAAFEAPGAFGEALLNVPVRLITDDAAALGGAARFAMEPEVPAVSKMAARA